MKEGERELEEKRRREDRAHKLQALRLPTCLSVNISYPTALLST